MGRGWWRLRGVVVGLRLLGGIDLFVIMGWGCMGYVEDDIMML